MDLASTPEQGQSVEVRQRHYVVAGVVQCSPALTPLVSYIEKLQHLVSLTLVEDDALGKGLGVIWETETLWPFSGLYRFLGRFA